MAADIDTRVIFECSGDHWLGKSSNWFISLIAIKKAFPAARWVTTDSIRSSGLTLDSAREAKKDRRIGVDRIFVRIRFVGAAAAASETSCFVLRHCRLRNTLYFMKTLTVRLPEPLVAEIEAESRGRKCSKSDVVRERLQRADHHGRRRPQPLDAIADLIGSVDGLPANLSARKKRFLKITGYGRKRNR